MRGTDMTAAARTAQPLRGGNIVLSHDVALHTIETELILALVEALCERFTKADHLMQQVHQEHRGNCLPPSRGCWDHCAELRGLRDEALTWLEQYAAEHPEPRQAEMFEEVAG